MLPHSKLVGLLLLNISAKHLEDDHRSNEFRTDLLVMFGGVMLGPVVGIIVFSWAPIDTELFLAFAITEPMEAHVHGFGVRGLDFAIDHSISHCVVGLESCGGFLVA